MGLTPAIAEQTQSAPAPTPTPAQKNPDTMNYTEPYMVTLHPATEMNIIWLTKELCNGYVEYGEKHDLWMLGHTLVWHNQTPDFYWYRENGEPKSREELIETMREHIETVA